MPSSLLLQLSDYFSQEGSRVYTPVRLGFPRETLEGATYRGMNIPKGTVSVAERVRALPAGLTMPAHYHEPLFR